MSQIHSQGRKGRDISALLQVLKSYPFPSGTPFAKNDPNQYSEADLRGVVSVISAKIQDYIVKNPKDFDFAELIKSKLGEEFEQYQEGGIHRELLDTKTLKRCFISEEASQSTTNILEAFRRVCEKEKQRAEEFKRVTGMYLVFSTHSTRPGRFQTSLMKIGQNDIVHKYKDSDYEVTERKLSAEMISNTTLLLTQMEDKFALLFYLYIGATNHPPFLQAVNLFTNRLGNTVANLALFARVAVETSEEEETFFTEFEPEREIDEIPDVISQLENHPTYVEQDPDLTVRKNIQYFLLHQARPIATAMHDNLIPFDFSKRVAVKPAPDGQVARFYNKTREYAGDYYIYFNERFKSALKEDEGELFKKNASFSTVGRGIFKIEVDDKTGVLKCSMRTRRNVEGAVLKHEGFIFNARLGMAQYLLMTLFSGTESDRCITFLFKIIDDNKMVGGHVIAYSSFGKLGAGAVIMIKKSVITGKPEGVEVDKLQQQEEEEPTAFFPFSSGVKPGLERNIVNLLSSRRRSLVIPPEDYEDLERMGADNKYEGLYKVYSSGQDGGISIGLLKIYRNGYVCHQDAHGERAVGQIEQGQAGNVLNIILRNENSGRTGFCCIGVSSEPPKDNITFYRGTFAGVSRKNGDIPIASQFLMEFMGKDKSFQENVNLTRSIEAGSPEMQSLRTKVINFLTNEVTKITYGRRIHDLNNLE
jgi:hypothetical protein